VAENAEEEYGAARSSPLTGVHDKHARASVTREVMAIKRRNITVGRCSEHTNWS